MVYETLNLDFCKGSRCSFFAASAILSVLRTEKNNLLKFIRCLQILKNNFFTTIHFSKFSGKDESSSFVI